MSKAKVKGSRKVWVPVVAQQFTLKDIFQNLSKDLQNIVKECLFEVDGKAQKYMLHDHDIMFKDEVHHYVKTSHGYMDNECQHIIPNNTSIYVPAIPDSICVQIPNHVQSIANTLEIGNVPLKVLIFGALTGVRNTLDGYSSPMSSLIKGNLFKGKMNVSVTKFWLSRRVPSQLADDLCRVATSRPRMVINLISLCYLIIDEKIEADNLIRATGYSGKWKSVLMESLLLIFLDYIEYTVTNNISKLDQLKCYKINGIPWDILTNYMNYDYLIKLRSVEIFYMNNERRKIDMKLFNGRYLKWRNQEHNLVILRKVIRELCVVNTTNGGIYMLRATETLDVIR